MTKSELDKLKECLKYDATSGNFTWIKRTSHAIRIGAIAGCVNKRGYLVIRVHGKLYYAHRLAYYFIYGQIKKQIDHINRNRKDNRIANLRDISNLENSLNTGLRKTNRTGKTGVSFCNVYKKYVAYITVNDKRKTLGYRERLEDAVRLRINAELKYYGRTL